MHKYINLNLTGEQISGSFYCYYVNQINVRTYRLWDIQKCVNTKLEKMFFFIYHAVIMLQGILLLHYLTHLSDINIETK